MVLYLDRLFCDSLAPDTLGKPLTEVIPPPLLVWLPYLVRPVQQIYQVKTRTRTDTRRGHMSYSYACRSSSQPLGRECPKPQNYSENKLMEALTAIIKSLVNDKNFDKMVDVAIGQKTDVSELEKEKSLRLKELERLNRLVTQLENQLDTLDYSSKAAELKEKSLNKRLDKALEDMEDIQSQLAELDDQMEKIAAAEETKKQVYGILQSFDVLFDIMDNADRKLLIKELIEKIELYPRQNLSGQWIKTIHFRFPMYYNDNNEASCAVCFDLNGNFLPKKSNDESIVCLCRQ